MLKLTRKVEYGLIALRHLRRQDEKTISSAKEIAEAYGLPAHLLAKTLQQMAREGLLKTIQGPKGGYLVTEKVSNMSLNTFIEMMEGPVGLMDCSIDSNCDQEPTCNIRMPITKINSTIRKVFEGMTLTEITN